MIVGFHIDYAIYVCRRMDDVGRAEREAQRWDPLVPEDEAIRMHQADGPKYVCLGADEKPVMVGGVHLAQPWLGVTWMLGTPGWEAKKLEVARASRKVIRSCIDDGGLLRVQMLTMSGSAEAKKWFELLGLEFESCLPCWGKEGETFYMYAVTKETTHV